MAHPAAPGTEAPPLIVTNRQPYRHDRDPDGTVSVDTPCGGVVTGLDTIARSTGATWIAWGDGDADRSVTDEDGTLSVPPDEPSYTLVRVWLDPDEVAGYYRGYANQVLWPLCHAELDPLAYTESDWETYRAVNRRFVERIQSLGKQTQPIWFQDYHFALAPAMLRDSHIGPITHFWHIPWPAPEIFARCPNRCDIVEGLLGNDVIAFHQATYAHNFLASVDLFGPPATVDYANRTLTLEDRVVSVEVAPLGIDVVSNREAARQAPPARSLGVPETKHRLLGVDRLDYIKGIPERLDGIERLLATEPSLHGQLTYVQKSTGSREGVPAYRSLQDTVATRIDDVNERFGHADWHPIVEIDRFLPQTELAALYRDADVLLVTSRSDGMNLVAQEFVAAQVAKPGVLILSEFAGCHEQLGDAALSINPYDTADLARTISQALSMPHHERQSRMQRLQSMVAQLDSQAWLETMTATDRTLPGSQPLLAGE